MLEGAADGRPHNSYELPVSRPAVVIPNLLHKIEIDLFGPWTQSEGRGEIPVTSFYALRARNKFERFGRFFEITGIFAPVETAVDFSILAVVESVYKRRVLELHHQIRRRAVDHGVEPGIGRLYNYTFPLL